MTVIPSWQRFPPSNISNLTEVDRNQHELLSQGKTHWDEQPKLESKESSSTLHGWRERFQSGELDTSKIAEMVVSGVSFGDLELKEFEDLVTCSKAWPAEFSSPAWGIIREAYRNAIGIKPVDQETKMLLQESINDAEYQRILSEHEEHLRQQERKHGDQFPRSLKEITNEVKGQPGFLADYINHASGLTDAPAEFHMAVGLSVFSTALANHVYFQTWGQRYYPTNWILLTAPSGFYRKSTCISIGKKVLIDASLNQQLFPARWSYEKLLEMLAAQSAGLLIFGEFAGFLAALNKDYASGAKEDLTELFDGTSLMERATEGGGRITIKDPALNLLGATVMDWLSGKLRERDLLGGFLSRYLIVPAREKDRWMGLTNDWNRDLHDKVVQGLAQAGKLEGEISWQGIRPDFETWLKKFENGFSSDARLMGLASRVPSHCLKLATLFALSETGQVKEISPNAFELAKKLVLALYRETSNILLNEVTTSAFQTHRKKVLEAIEQRPGIGRRELLRKLHLSIRDFDEIVNTLLAEESIRQEEAHRGSRASVCYWPSG